MAEENKRENKKIIIALDAMGGDKAPDEIIKGCVEVFRVCDNLKVFLIGKQEIIKKKLDEYKGQGLDFDIEIIDAQEIILNNESPTWAIKNKKESSIVKGLNLVKEEKADGFVSAGSTGALLSCATILLKRLPGINRPVLATLLPTANENKFVILLDSGANVDCKAIYLEQFAHMGYVYMKNIMKINKPRVGLINIGTENSKGNILTKEAYDLLSNSDLNFIGNIEARDIFSGIADVLVCDGFVGNIILKNIEGMAKNIFGMLKNDIKKNILRKFGGLLVKPAFINLKKKFDYNEIGGAPFLGLNSIVVKIHGASDYRAVKNAIMQCVGFVKNDLKEKIKIMGA